MKTITPRLLFVLFLCGTFYDAAPAQGQSALSNIYRDKNGFFALVPPTSWQQRDYPGEPRSKVAFHHPGQESIHFRILAGPSDETSEAMVQDLRTRIVSSAKRIDSNANVSIEETTFRDLRAVRIRVSTRMGEQEILQFISTGIKYSISFGTDSKKQFDEYESTFKNFLDNFLIIENSGRKITDDEIRRSLSANKKRIAELYEEAGLLNDAIQKVDEGLKITLDNKSLREYRKKLLAKQEMTKK